MKRICLPVVLMLGILFVQCAGNTGKKDAEKAVAESSAAAKETPQSGKYTILPIPEVAAEKILETIVAEYKGEPVFVDFWATWCGPCLNAMQAMKPIKPQMAEKGIKTLYISNASSPKEKWSAMLPEIGGLHYYLEEEQWRAIVDQYNIVGIPTYMIFDKSGTKTFETAGYPGNDVMLAELAKVW